MDAQEKKLRQSILITIVVGLVLTILLAVGLVTQVVNKQRALIASTKAQYVTKKGEADQLPQALLAQRKAEDKQEYAKGQLAFFRQRYRSLRFDALTPEQLATATLSEADKVNLQPLLNTNRKVAWQRWMNEYASGYGIALRRELIRIANATRVTLKTGITVGDPPKAPEEANPPANGLFRPTGASLPITVTGSLADIVRFFDQVNQQSSILMLINNDIKLGGYSPDITATFSITPYLLANGDGAPVTAGAGAAAGSEGGAPAAAGGYPSSSSSGYPSSSSSSYPSSSSPSSSAGASNAAP
jgi:hypothetical protein